MDLFKQFLTASKVVNKATDETPTIAIKKSGGIDLKHVGGNRCVWWCDSRLDTNLEKLEQTGKQSIHFIVTDTETENEEIIKALPINPKKHTSLLACKSGTQIKFTGEDIAVVSLFFNYIEKNSPEKVKPQGKGYTAIDDLRKAEAVNVGKNEYKHYYYEITMKAELSEELATVLCENIVEQAGKMLGKAQEDNATDAEIKALEEALEEAKKQAQSVKDKLEARRNKAQTEAEA